MIRSENGGECYPTLQTVKGFLFILAREILGSGLGVGLSWSVQDQLAFGLNSDLEFAPV